MKYGIPVATFILLGAAIGLHRSAPSHAPEAREGGTVAVEPGKPVEHASGPAVAAEPPKPESAPDHHRPGAVAVARPASGAPGTKLLAALDRELGLTAVQKEAVDRILRDREGEIRQCHDAIRRSGVLDMRHYEWQVALLKAAWFRKIDSLLDTVQHERFVALVEQGFFNDGLAFTHEPGMTVLD